MSQATERGNTRILFVAPYMCRGDGAAGDLRLQRLLEILGRSASVDFLVPEREPLRSEVGHRYWRILQDAGVRIVDSSLFDRIDVWCESRPAPYDWIIVEFWHQVERCVAALSRIRLRQSITRLAVDTVDVHFLREYAALERGLGDYGLSSEIEQRKQRELSAYRSADLLIACSIGDLVALTGDVPEVPSVVVPIIINRTPRRVGGREKLLVFIGGFRHAPNVDAVVWFVREVYPLVRMCVPDVRLAIIGSHTPVEVQSLAETVGVEVVGFVPDTSVWLDCAAVSVAPLRYGAGMKGKVTEALSAGVPVVTTSFGAQGLGAVSGVHLRIADSAQEFASAVVACLADPVAAEAMGARGQELVVSICGAERVGGDLLNALACHRAAQAEPVATNRPLSRLLASLKCRAWIVEGAAHRMLRWVKRCIVKLCR